MISFIFNERTLISKDWATFIFIACFVLIAVTKTTWGTRFSDFMRLAYSDKYMKIYKDSSNVLSGFTVTLFVIQIISLSFIIQFILSYYGLTTKTNWVAFIQLFTFISVFILAKYLVEKIVATSFNIETFSETLNLYKVSYRTYITLLLLPVTIILFYNPDPKPFIVYSIIGLLVVANIISYLVSIRLYQSLILSKLFYFILYLCTLEIAPYYFMYYWFTNSK